MKHFSLKQCSEMLHYCVRQFCETCPYKDDTESLACMAQLMTDVEHKINLVTAQVDYL